MVFIILLYLVHIVCVYVATVAVCGHVHLLLYLTRIPVRV